MPQPFTETNEFKSCLICNHRHLVDLLGYEKDKLTRCKNCGFVFAKQIPTAEELMTTYNDYPRSNAISEITIKRYCELLGNFDKYRQTNSLIDVGAGDGHFVGIAKKMGWKTYATEFESRSVALCREKGAITHEGKLDAQNYQPGMFDVVFSAEVIEHINNPVEEVQNFHQILRKGGLVYVTTPNFNSIARWYLKNKWNVIHYPEHLCYYTPKTLEKLFTDNGFKKVEITTTGFSPARFFYAINPVTSTSTIDESLRQSSETKPLLRFAKWGINAMLNVSKTGDALKGQFVKV